MELYKKEDESYFKFLCRITDLLDTNQIGYTEWGYALLGDNCCYSSDNLRKASYFIRKMIPIMAKDTISDWLEYDTVGYIEKQMDELYKAKVKVQDANREKRKHLREEARYENLLEVMLDHMDYLPDIKLNECIVDVKGSAEGAIILSDWHYGYKCDNSLNYYDTNVAKECIEKLMNKVIKQCIKNNIKKLHINLASDFVSGTIHNSTRVEQEEDIITQIIEVSELISNFVNGVKKYVPEVVVYGVQGNHDRVSANKTDSLQRENYCRLINEFVRNRCTNVKVITNGAEDYCIYNMKGNIVYLAHGDKDNISNIKQNCVNLTGKVPRFCFCGHLHHFEAKDDNNCDIVMNGSLISTDGYAVGVRKHTPRYQVMVIIDEDNDVQINKLYL